MKLLLTLTRSMRLPSPGSALALLCGVVVLGLLAGATDDQIPIAFAVAGIGTLLVMLFIKVRSAEEDVGFLCGVFIAVVPLYDER